ncbi:helix-turn-helix domain-containing protein [Catenuloplanes japonicus]|uniref:helix-turn-helix domain-containing protein n=1 Tax=Catenuloplanes japonicus TaxID=33876 RepID=UPI000690D1B1|nr:helix-turn-helix transcriptional regulator [Catenuloplanes japonicus]
MSTFDPPPGARPLGPLLAAMRRGHGWSQQRLADLLCDASGAPTVTRHEISRWERQERVPGGFWLGWLATVLGTDPSALTRAAAVVRRALPADAARPAVPGAAAETAALRRAAHAWLADPSGDADARAAPALSRRLARLAATLSPATAPPVGRAGPVPAPLPGLRRLDDLVGGADLAATLVHRLGPPPAAPGRAAAPAAAAPAVLTAIAERAQLIGWVAADAGRWRTAVAAHRVAVQAAHAAGARALAGYALSSASHLITEAGDPATGLLLAHTARAGATRASTATGRALLLHRTALACAVAGSERAAQSALDAARRAAEASDPVRDPAWLYWLTGDELDGMTGRCLAALGRPMRAAEPLRHAVLAAPGPRTAALHGTWLARAYADGGDVERACAAGSVALHDAIRAGSVRAATQVRRLQSRLAVHAAHPAARQHREEFEADQSYLADVRSGLAVA